MRNLERGVNRYDWEGLENLTSDGCPNSFERRVVIVPVQAKATMQLGSVSLTKPVVYPR
jgi:hypothetical protein